MSVVTNDGYQQGLKGRRIALGIALLCSVAALCAYHYVTHLIDRNPALEALTDGRWRRYSPRGGSAGLSDEQREQIAQLETIGYLSGSMPAPDAHGVTVYDKALAYNGLNLYVSGHDDEALLMDMEGNVLHRWKYEFFRIWPKQRVSVALHGHECWRRAHLFDNGDLLAMYNGYGLVKLDKDSNLLWAIAQRFHHDFEVLEDGTIYILSRVARVLPRIDEDFPVLEDFISILNPDGQEVRRISLLEALEDSDYAHILSHMRSRGDILHTNTIEYLDGSVAGASPLFGKGNLLISVRELDTVAIVDPQTERVVWAMVGPWDAQHQPTLLDNGHMLVFDNEGLGRRSRVLEFDPLTAATIWSYGDAPSETFYSSSCGSCARLPNGNTLITESDNGRAFEVTPDKRIVWEFVNPHRAGENNELIATLFEVVRFEPDFPQDWLDRADSAVANPRIR